MSLVYFLGEPQAKERGLSEETNLVKQSLAAEDFMPFFGLISRKMRESVVTLEEKEEKKKERGQKHCLRE